MAKAKLKLDVAKIVELIREKQTTKLNDLLMRMEATAVKEAPLGKAREKTGRGNRQFRTGSPTGFTVDVEMTPDGPRIPQGSRTSASASRYIKTKTQDQLTPVPGNVNLFRYTFKRHQPGTLRRSIEMIPAVDGVGYVVAKARYAKHVHRGARGRAPNQFFTRTLEAHRDEFVDGKFLKG